MSYSLDIPHEDLKGVGYLLRIVTSFVLSSSRVIVLILRQQTNVVIDQGSVLVW